MKGKRRGAKMKLPGNPDPSKSRLRRGRFGANFKATKIRPNKSPVGKDEEE